MDKRFFYSSPCGKLHLLIEMEEDTIMGISFCAPQEPSRPENELETELLRQLDAYFEGKLTEFDLPFFATGTVFQLLVWEELIKIPCGQTITYGELAERIGKPQAARAVGSALHANPIPILIPCHRVVGANGQLTGFAGGLDTKQALLELERKYKA